MLSENLPDPGKAQDFMKKFDQFLEEDERIRSQLDVLVSPNCSCKLAEGCVVIAEIIKYTSALNISNNTLSLFKYFFFFFVDSVKSPEN